MIFALHVWFMPALAAASSSYLVSLLWERFRPATAPSGMMAGFLSALSFVMGGISAYFRDLRFAPTLESNVIIMFVAGASTTYLWLLIRGFLPGLNRRPRI